MQLIKKAATLWFFSRPHTVIGSVFSIVTLYLLSASEGHTNLTLLITTLVAGLGCNLFITGLNQIIDLPVDVINKPYLPLPQQQLNLFQAKLIIAVSLIVSLIFAIVSSLSLLLLIVVITAIGVAYSVPPIQLKRHHVPAAIAIAGVRGVLVNLGMAWHFTSVLYEKPFIPAMVVPLTLFIVAFSIAIAWFKDLPDTAGDEHFGFKTMPLLYSKKTALITGAVIVVMAYAYCWYWFANYGFATLSSIHLLLMGIFLWWVTRVNFNQQKSIKQFYLGFWVLFFLEYSLFAALGYFG